jgi:hypothetical protein
MISPRMNIETIYNRTRPTPDRHRNTEPRDTSKKHPADIMLINKEDKDWRGTTFIVINKLKCDRSQSLRQVEEIPPQVID